MGVYPRTHGEYMVLILSPPPRLGLSPYTRGILSECSTFTLNAGSIPVHTGNTMYGSRYAEYLRVYPRTHGEYAYWSYGCPLSRVYPRTHGEYGFAVYRREQNEGLSPYTRGILVLLLAAPAVWGSIPVHTGNTRPRWSRESRDRVYPRTHGEYEDGLLSIADRNGLSPYTRGIPFSLYDDQYRDGSIPVHTGNTILGAMEKIGYGVYPRTHGEYC